MPLSLGESGFKSHENSLKNAVSSCFPANLSPKLTNGGFLTLKLDATSPPDLGGTPQNPEEPISSSHRALNKMVMGILNGTLIGGALVLPTRELYNYLYSKRS
jgi:hypothetical protein